MNETTPQRSDIERDDEFDFITLLDVLIQNRWLICGAALIFTLIGATYAFVANPVYTSNISFQVEDSPDTSAAKSLIGDVSSLFEVKSTAAAEVQILGSRLVVTSVVDNLKLYITAEPRYFPIIGRRIARDKHSLSTPGILGHGGFAWGNERISVPQFDVPDKLYTKLYRVTALTAGRFAISGPGIDDDQVGQVGVPLTLNTDDGPIKLQIASIHGNPGTRFDLVRYSRLQTISDLQDALDVQEKVKQSGVIIASLQNNSPFLVAEELNEIGRQYIKQNIERKSADAAQSLDFLNARLPVLKRELETAEERYTALRNQRGTIDLSEEAKLALGQASDATSKMLELRQKRDELETRFTSTHPAIVALNEQIAALAAQQAAYDKSIRRLPDIQQDIVRLTLDVKVNTDLYVALLNSAQQLQLIKAGKVGNVRWVDHATIPEDPVKPKKKIVVALSLFLGLCVGIGIAFLRNMLFRGVEDPSQIERFTGLNVYASIPYSQKQVDLMKGLRDKDKQAVLLATAFPTEPAVESLRSLRTALQFAMLESRNNIVLLTGPAPAVGKSFVSANFAAILATAGKRVLLIDGDMRKGYLQLYFGFDRKNGLSEVIGGTATLEQNIHKSVIENLDFLSTGVLPPNPAELLLNERLPQLLSKVSSLYDIVLLDSPPVLATADTSILAPAAGTLFLVAMSGVTKIGEITESAKRLSQVGVHANGVLFNGIRSGIGRYAYGSKYGSYRYVAYNYNSVDEKG